jgi:acetyl-CoA carboxylase biotin carboxyl carrier protein
MIDFEFVESLIRALDASSVDSLELERGGTRIRLSKSPDSASFAAPFQPSPVGGKPALAHNPGAPAGTTAPAVEEEPSELEAGGEEKAEEEDLLEVTSPMVGTFYRAPAPDAPPYVDVGDPVGEGTVLCIIEAMKLMNELESEVEGTIRKILVENAEPVEFGQTLFLVDPS